MHYILSREKIEGLAKEILEEYNAEYLVTPKPLDVYDFMENFMELKSDFKNLSQDNSVLGLTSFNDGIYFVWNDDRTDYYPIEVKDGTVILENSLIDKRFEGRERFTVMHECSHQILHRKCLSKPDDSTNECIVACYKKDIEPSGRKKLRTPKDWIEWQANALAASFLMPIDMVKIAFNEIILSRSEVKELPLNLNLAIDVLIFDVAKLFNVSYFSMKIRLENLGLIKIRVYDFDDVYLNDKQEETVVIYND